MRKDILRTALTIGVALSAANLWYLAGLLHTYWLLGDPAEVLTAGAESQTATVERMRQICGRYADVYAHCARSEQMAFATLAETMGSMRLLTAIEAGVSLVFMMLFLILLVAALRQPRNAGI